MNKLIYDKRRIKLIKHDIGNTKKAKHFDKLCAQCIFTIDARKCPKDSNGVLYCVLRSDELMCWVFEKQVNQIEII